ncbi:MAG: HutD/Ves family protein [Noviherbaspirillum sp.]
MKKLTTADYVTMPWKNGGGVTTQLAIAPPDADLNNFDWRISTAQVAEAGPFSLFAGIDRSIAVLQGGGMAFDLGGIHTTILTPDNKPFVFRGEQHVHATLLDGPISDFNVMTRRTCWTHELQTVRLCGALQWTLNTDLMFLYCAHGASVRCRNARGEEIDCAAGDAILIDAGDGDHVDLSTTEPAGLYVVHLSYKGNPDVQ